VVESLIAAGGLISATREYLQLVRRLIDSVSWAELAPGQIFGAPTGTNRAIDRGVRQADTMSRSSEMKFEEDPRIKVARRGFVLSWTYFSVFLAAALGVAAAFGNEPLMFGLPRWVTLSCIIVPSVFVAALIPIVEKLIPDISLSDEEEGAP
jgi:uncharacterized membrane protein YhdT